MPKLPWRKWFQQDWLSDEEVAQTSPAARGLWIECLNVMMNKSRESLSGTAESLSKMLRFTPEQFTAALKELQKTSAAEICYSNALGNEIVTITCRRFVREAKERERIRLAVKTIRERESVTPTVTECNSPSPSPSVSSPRNGGVGEGVFSECPSWLEFWAYCQTQACLLPAEWYARDKWEAANQSNWKDKTNWKAYARRCKGWWDADGRPKSPPSNSKAQNDKPQITLMQKIINELP